MGHIVLAGQEMLQLVLNTQPIAQQVQQFAMSTAPLPIWLDYAKALGAPFVALVAAAIASAISYQQWRTARNKLRLDLFDKRLKVFEACNALIREIHMPVPIEVGHFQELMSAVQSARWLFNDEVAEYVDSLLQRGSAALMKPKPEYEQMSDEQKLEFAKAHLRKTQAPVMEDISILYKHFAPFLKLEH